ncbi:MAG: flagellar basal body P-ring protein FlgI [Acidaminococcales bacterium]|jgi:flagellar P-ring protein precursor FlgI|nr:flagellar basal body P-ring protein FlgI [Acidaminococcales bacterium]
MRTIICLVAAALTLCFSFPLEAARIKDLAKVEGVRDNQLLGYGVVVGLNGTGDSTKSDYTIMSIVNMMRNFGITVNVNDIKPKNVAAVIVTAKLPAFAKPGDTIDINVASVGDAKSIQGGVLLQSPLQAANGDVYAVAQGPVSIGGYSAGGGGGGQQKNHPTAGMVSNGAIVERGTSTALASDGVLRLSLNKPDFTTADRVANRINAVWGGIAMASDAGTVSVSIPGGGHDIVGFIASIEEISVDPDQAAKVVLNERTGTVVMGGNVGISEVAVSQGGLTVTITKSTEVSQPGPFTPGQTVVTGNTETNVQEEKVNLIVLPTSTKVSDVVTALNAAGATPRDIMTILQAMQSAGALHAVIEMI